MPWRSQISFNARTNSRGIGMNPPSPCTGSSTTHATVAGSTSALNSSSTASIASSELTPRYGYGAGARGGGGGGGAGAGGAGAAPAPRARPRPPAFLALFFPLLQHGQQRAA